MMDGLIGKIVTADVKKYTGQDRVNRHLMDGPL